MDARATDGSRDTRSVSALSAAEQEGAGTDPDVRRTSSISILSSTHGRMRRAQRAIEKRDLQAALKHGIKEPGFPCPRTGARRWRHTFAGVVFITDELNREITSWPVPGSGLDVEPVSITPGMRQAHDKACREIKTHPSSWTSYTVVVVDQSGSMRRTDVAGGVTRSDAVWLTLATEFVAANLENKSMASTDVMSIVGMNASCAVLVDEEPIDWILYNKIIGLLRSAEPLAEGNYLPAFAEAERLLSSITHGSCALSLLFLSDGKPSDHFHRSDHEIGLTKVERIALSKNHSKKMDLLLGPHIDNLFSRFGRRLTVHTVGFAAPTEDFSVLRSVADRSAAFGCPGKFRLPDLTAESLGLAISSVASSLTAAKSELTSVGTTSQQTVRDVRREPKGAPDEFRVDPTTWWYYDSHSIESKRRWSEYRQREKRDDGSTRYFNKGAWEHLELPRDTGVAQKKIYFGEGAERLVAKFREVDQGQGNFVGDRMVIICAIIFEQTIVNIIRRAEY